MRARSAILIAGLTGLCLTTSSAQAADYGIAPYEGVETENRSEIYDAPPPAVTERFREQRIERGPSYVEEDQIYGRPRPAWHRSEYPAAAQPWWRGEDCRVIIKRRMNPWGEVIERRIRVCD